MGIALAGSLNAQTTVVLDLPLSTSYYQELSTVHDDALQHNLDKIVLKNKKWSQLARSKKLAFGIVDLRQVDNIKYAAVNGNHMMYAASLPKIAVLLAAMEAIKSNCIAYDEALKKDLRLMIARSNNAATTRVIERLGFDQIASVLRDDKYNLYEPSHGGGLWVGKKYAKAGAKKPDPLKGLSHAATVEQVCRFYTMLAFGKLVDEEYSQDMLGYLIDPEINHKFVKVLNRIAPDCDIYRKSGSWRNFHSDSALVYGKGGRKYILVALIEDEHGSQICQQLVTSAEKALGVTKEKKVKLLAQKL